MKREIRNTNNASRDTREMRNEGGPEMKKEQTRTLDIEDMHRMATIVRDSNDAVIMMLAK